jgi:pimeloyl-ACP methyl ester carboxylesterase
LAGRVHRVDTATAWQVPDDRWVVHIPTLPVAVTEFPAEIYRAPRSWGEKAFGNLIYWNEVDKGGHFAAWEQPQLLSEEVRAAFRSLR